MKKFLEKIRHLFTPHHGNNHQPHLLSHEAVFSIFLVIIVIEISFLVQTFVVLDKTKFLASVLPGVLTALTNDERSQYENPPLANNLLLEKAAQMKADDMAKKGYFAHTSPDGKSPWYWLDQVGYDYQYAGENLAVNFSESIDVTRAWMNSPSHKANIIKKEYTEVGIAVARGMYKGKETTFVAQFFGTPKTKVLASSDSFTTEITNMPTVETKEEAEESEIAEIVPIEIVLGEETQEEAIVEEATAPLVEEKEFSLVLAKVATNPVRSSGYLLFLLFLLVFIPTTLLLFVRAELRHPKVLTRGVLMIGIIIFLFFLNMNVVKTRPDIPLESDNSQSFLASSE